MGGRGESRPPGLTRRLPGAQPKHHAPTASSGPEACIEGSCQVRRVVPMRSVNRGSLLGTSPALDTSRRRIGATRGERIVCGLDPGCLRTSRLRGLRQMTGGTTTRGLSSDTVVAARVLLLLLLRVGDLPLAINLAEGHPDLSGAQRLFQVDHHLALGGACKDRWAALADTEANAKQLDPPDVVGYLFFSLGPV